MKTGAEGIKLIKSFESLRLDAYKCPAGIWTIGWGHTGNVKEGDKVTLETAEQLIRMDLEDAEKSVNKRVTLELSQNMFDALVCLVFNIGDKQFKDSTLLKELNKGNLFKAADQFLVWNKAENPQTGKLEVSKGLARRRQMENLLFVSGI